MASGAVWGIDIGQCALKALRCRAHEDPGKIIADAFDFIEYPKSLTQVGADPAELIGDALKQFLSRNTVQGDRVAISVSGQAGLARFIKLPPVEAKKIPDIVRYEARQQLPCDLNDVIWDYQRMGGGSEEEGFALETEVGLFAMKRDAVLRALDPFLQADIEVDIVQLSPLVLYNFVLFDQLEKLPSPEDYDPENPPESIIIISLGTDATDLVITNGFRVWQRSIPLGGSHFTKALTKELKLTYAKAEHLKRNATMASDPKAVFQAMRPVFSDLLTELQRSISYFSNLDRSAKIGRVLALGNAMKLPGLRRYLSQSLGFEIEKLETFRRLTGPQVTSAPAFQENILSFAVTYGLALQGLDKGGIHTNLLPKEIVLDRMIKRKKPWAVAAAAALMLGCGISFSAYAMTYGKVEPSQWAQAEQQAAQVSQEAGKFRSEDEAARSKFKETDAIGQRLVGNIEGRLRWLEMLKAVNACLPPYSPAESEDWSVSIEKRGDLHITSLTSVRVEDASKWYVGGVKATYEQYIKDQGGERVEPGTASGEGGSATAGAAAGAGGTENGAPPSPAPGAAGASQEAGASSGPSGKGWIVTLQGHHYHNADLDNQAGYYVGQTLIRKLLNGTVRLPNESGELEEISLKELGISYPVLRYASKLIEERVADPNDRTAEGMSGHAKGGAVVGGRLGIKTPQTRPGPVAGPVAGETPRSVVVKRCNFTVQFLWQPETALERRMAKKGQGTSPEGATAQ